MYAPPLPPVTYPYGRCAPCVSPYISSASTREYWAVAALARNPVMSAGPIIIVDPMFDSMRYPPKSKANWMALVAEPGQLAGDGDVLVPRDVHERLDEPALVALGRREVHRERAGRCR